MENLKAKIIPVTRINPKKKKKRLHSIELKSLTMLPENDPTLYRNHSHISTCLHILPVLQLLVGNKDSVVSTVTSYGLDSPGFKPWQVRDFPHPYRPAPKLTQSPTQCVLDLFSRCKGLWGCVWVQIPLSPSVPLFHVTGWPLPLPYGYYLFN